MNKLVNIFLSFLFLIVGGLESFAQSTISNLPLAKWFITPTETKLIFMDGREASLNLEIRKKVKIQSKAVIVENTCYPDLIPNDCTLNYELGSYELSFIWTKHPDISKINQVVSLKIQDGKINLSTTLSEFNSFNFPIANEYKSSSEHVLNCKSNEWIQKLPQNEDNNYLIYAWGAEFMSNNSITGKTENATVAQSNQIELVPIDSNTWKYKFSSVNIGIDYLVPLVDPNIIYYESNNRQCAIKIKLEKDIRQSLYSSITQPIIKKIPFSLSGSVSKFIIFETVISYVKTYITSSNSVKDLVVE